MNREGTGGGGGVSWAWAIVLVPAGLVVVLLAAALLLTGLRFGTSSGGGEDDGDTGPMPVLGPAASADAVVRTGRAGDRLTPPATVDGPIRPGALVDVQAAGFVGNAAGVVAQCDGLRSRACRNLFPVRTDDEGRVRALYRLGGGPAADVGTLVVEVDGARAGAWLDGRRRPVAQVEGTGAVQVTGLRAGEALTVTLCGEFVEELGRCRAERRALADARGRAAVALPEVRRGERVVLTDETGTTLAEPLAVDSPRVGAERGENLDVDLDPRRLRLGLFVALLLVATALVLVRTTDWRAPSEAAIDEAPGGWS